MKLIRPIAHVGAVIALLGTSFPGVAGADTNPATSPLALTCGAVPSVDLGAPDRVAVGDSVSLSSSLALDAGQTYQDILTRPDGTEYYASFVQLAYDDTYLDPSSAPVLTVAGVPTAVVAGGAPSATAWVLDSSVPGTLRVYFPGVPDTNGDGVPSYLVPAGGASIALTMQATVTAPSPTDPAPGADFAAASCEAGAATGPSNRATAVQTSMLTIAEPAVTVAKTADPTVSAPGGTVTYSIRVSNSGTSANGAAAAPAFDLHIVDTADSGVTVVSAGNGGTLNGSSVEWTIPRLDPGQNQVLTYTATMPTGLDPTQQTVVANHVDVTSTGLPGDVDGERTFTASDDEDVTVGLPAPTITKSGKLDVAPIGQPTTFTVRATVPAGGPYFDALIWDQIPDGIAVDPASINLNCVTGCTGGEPAITPLTTFTSPGGFTRIGSFLGDLPAATADRLYELTYSVVIAATDVDHNAPTLGEIFTNTATVSYNAIDRSGAVTPNLSSPPTADSHATATDTLEYNRPVLEIEKIANTASPVDLDPAAPITYTIKVCNSGGIDATNVGVKDTFHPSGDIGKISGILSSSGVVNLDRATSPATFYVDTVPAGECVEFTYGVKFDGQLGSPNADNVAAVTSLSDLTGNTYDVADIPPAEATVKINSPMLTIEKTPVIPLVSTASTSIDWNITITNTGTGTAYYVQLSDFLPAGMDTSSVATSGWTEIGSNIFAFDGTLAPGASASLVVTTKGTIEPGTLTNTAQVSWEDGAGNSSTKFNGVLTPWIASDDGTVEAVAPSLQILKTPDLNDNPTPYIVEGTSSAFTIRIINDGRVPLTNLVVDDVLPKHLTYTANSATDMFLAPGGYAGAAPVMTETIGQIDHAAWAIDQIPAGGVVTITLPVTQDGNRPSEPEYLNVATVKAAGVPLESDEGALVHLPAITPPTITKAATPAFGAPGDTINWTLTVVRPQNSVDVNDLTVVDSLPDGFTNVVFGAVTCSGGCTPAAADAVPLEVLMQADRTTSVGWHLGDVPAMSPEATYTLTFTAVVASNFDDGVQVIDGVREPFVNTARTYYNLSTNQPTPQAGERIGAYGTYFEYRGRKASAEFDVRTPHILVDKTIEGREPFTWTDPTDATKSYTTWAANPAESLTWSLVVTNDGSSTANEVKIYDDLGLGELDVTGFELPAGVTAQTTGAGVTFVFANPLAAGASVTIKYTATLPDSSQLSPDYTISPKDIDKVVNSFSGSYHTIGAGQAGDLAFTDVAGEPAEVDIFTPTLLTRVGPCLNLASDAIGQVQAQWYNYDWQTSWGNILWTKFPAAQTPDVGIAVDPVWTITLPAGLSFQPGTVLARGPQAGGAASFAGFRDPDSIVTNANGSTTLTWNLADQPYDRDYKPALDLRFSVKATSGPYKGGVTATITSDDVTGADRRGDATETASDLHIYRDTWTSGCGGNEFYKSVENKPYIVGQELQLAGAGEAVTWRMSEYSDTPLTNATMTDVLPLGVTATANSATFTVTLDGVATSITTGNPGYPSETITTLPSGQQQITWTGGVLAGPFEALNMSFSSQIAATAAPNTTLVNVAQLDTDQALASNTLPALPAGFTCADTADCDVAAVLIRNDAAPSVTKDVIAGATGIYGTTADYRIRVTIPADQAFEDLHLVDALGGSLPDLPGSGQNAAAANSAVTLSSACVSGCATPTELTGTQLAAVNSGAAQTATGWMFGDVAASASVRVFEIRYRITTLDLPIMCPVFATTSPASCEKSFINAVSLRHFNQPTDSTAFKPTDYWSSYSNTDRVTDGTATAVISRGVPVLNIAKSCVSPIDGTDVLQPVAAGANARCTISVTNSGSQNAYHVNLVDTPSTTAAGSGVPNFPVTWTRIAHSGTAPNATTPTSPWDGTTVEWASEDDTPLAPGETWTWVTDWHVSWDPAIFNATPTASASVTNNVARDVYTDDPADADPIGQLTSASDQLLIRPPRIKVTKQQSYTDPTTWPGPDVEGGMTGTQANIWNGQGAATPVCIGKSCSPWLDTNATVYVPGETVPVRLDLYLTSQSQLSTINLDDVLPFGFSYKPGSAKLVSATAVYPGFTAGPGSIQAAMSPVIHPIGDPAITDNAAGGCGILDNSHSGGDSLTWTFTQGSAGWQGAPWRTDGQVTPGIIRDPKSAITDHVVVIFDMVEDGAFACTAPPVVFDTYGNTVLAQAQTTTGGVLNAGQDSSGTEVLNRFTLDKTPDGGIVMDGSTGWFQISVANWGRAQFFSPKVPDAPFDRDATAFNATNVVLTDTIVDDGLYVPGTAVATFAYPDGSSGAAPFTEQSVTHGIDPATGRVNTTITWVVPTIPGGMWVDTKDCNNDPASIDPSYGVQCRVPTKFQLRMPIDVPVDTLDGTLYPNKVNATNSIADDTLPARCPTVKDGAPPCTALGEPPAAGDTWTADEVGDLTVRNPSPPPTPTKTATPQVAPGGIIDWEVSFTLEKNRVWWDLSYTDTLPSPIDFLGYGAVSCKYADDGMPCALHPSTLTPTGNTIGWYVGDITVASSRDRIITAKFRGQVTDPSWTTDDTVTNTVTGYSFDEDQTTPPTTPVTTADMVSTPGVAITEIVEPELAIHKTVAAGPFGAGDLITWSVTVTNNGDGTAYSSTVTDVPSTVVRDVVPTGDNAALAIKGWTAADPRVKWFIPSLAAGESITLKYEGYVVSDYADRGYSTADNTATVGPYSSQPPHIDNGRTYDPVTDDASAPLVAPKLAVEKFTTGDCTGMGATVGAGEHVTFCVRVTNIGTQTAKAVDLVDVLPRGWVYAAGTGVPTPVTGTTAWGTEMLTFSVGDLAVGQSATVTYDAFPNVPGAASAAENVVTAIAHLPDGTSGAGIPGYSATTQAPVALKAAGLELSKTPDQQIRNWAAGENAEWDLTVTNPSDSDLTGVTITDTFPGDWTFVTANPAATSMGTDASGRSVGAWEIGALAAGQSRTVHVVAHPPVQPSPVDSFGDAGRYDRNYAAADADQLSSTVEDDGYVKLYTPIQIGDLLWEDTNYDGQQTPGEPGVGGVKVYLTGVDMFGHPVVVETTTDENGDYVFTTDGDGNPLAPGTYTVRFDQPAGYTFTTQGSGSDLTNGTDSNVSSTGSTPELTVFTSTNTIDAGIVRPGSIGDHVWYDADADGIQDLGETPVPGVTVNLLDAEGNIIATTTTDENGDYLFENLMPGTYQVQFIAPPEYAFTLTIQGGNGNLDSDGELVTVTLGSGENRRDIDAGLIDSKVDLTKDVAHGPDAGGMVTWHLSVTNVGPGVLVNVVVTDPDSPDCDRTFAEMAWGETQEWDCVGPIPDDFINEAHVTSILKGTETRPGGGVKYTDDDDARVTVPTTTTTSTTAKPTTTTTETPTSTTAKPTASTTAPAAVKGSTTVRTPEKLAEKSIETTASPTNPGARTGGNLVFAAIALVLLAVGLVFALAGRRSRREDGAS